MSRPSTGTRVSRPASSGLENAPDIITPIPGVTPYGSPPASVPASTSAFSAANGHGLRIPRRYFHSRRVKKGEVEKPWLEKQDPREKWVTIIPCIAVGIGVAICGFLIWQGLSTVVNHKYCPVLMEDWSGGIRSSIWTHEVECGGYGNGQFEYTTNSQDNAFIQDGALHIKPILQNQDLITKDNVLNLTAQGLCTSSVLSDCVAVTNTTNGTIVNPVTSARLNTKVGASITYGRVEVEAKLPAGQWLWPAIWMLPVRNEYGPWPMSGEIDIMESRGNNWTYPQGGNDIISSTLHWGPDTVNDAWWRTNTKHQALHSTYSDKFYTFGIEWSENYIFTYVNSRLLQVMYTKFSEPLWKRGNFPLANKNGTIYVNPWAETGRDNTPFDQPFYLILNVAVGGTNGWFEDGIDGKPWVDGSGREKKDFWDAKNQWLPTWKENGEMVVKSVRMWQQCD